MKKMNPFFSVIIPVYNSSKYINECIDTILCQEFRDYEVIFIDDGSTDNSVEIISKRFQGNSNYKLIEQKNKGVSAARNIGLNNATGKYVMFMDSDDYWVKDILGQLQKILISNSNVDILFFNIFDDFSDMKKNHVVLPKFLGKKLSKNLAIESILSNRGYRGYGVNKVFKRSCIGNNRFDESITYLEDMLFCISCVLDANEFMGIDKCLYAYRWRPTSVVNTFGPSHMTFFDALDKIDDLIPDKFHDSITVKRRFAYIDFASRFIFKNKNQYKFFENKFRQEKRIFALNKFGLGKTELLPLALSNISFTVSVLTLNLIKKIKA